MFGEIFDETPIIGTFPDEKIVAVLWTMVWAFV